MRFPVIKPIPQTRDMITAFGGYNHNPHIRDNEFYEMTNLSSDNYPLLAPRKKRGTFLSHENHSAKGIVAKDSLCYVDGTKLYVNNEVITDFELTDSEKQLISMGSYIIVFPDKKYVNTKNLSDKGSIDINVVTTPGAVFELCDENGTCYGIISIDEPSDTGKKWIKPGGEIYEYTSNNTWAKKSDITIGDAPPDNPSIGHLWIDTKSDELNLSEWANTLGVNCWQKKGQSGTKISQFKISNGLQKGDKLTVSTQIGATLAARILAHIITAVFHSPPYNPALDVSGDGHINSQDTVGAISVDKSVSGIFEIVNIETTENGEGDYIVFNGKIACLKITTEPDYGEISSGTNNYFKNIPVTIERKMPDMDFVFEANNRLWGCRYGENAQGKFVNEIYASALGDFKLWDRFEGISTDSYTVSLGSDGEFTGGVNYLGYPVFFKENEMYKIYGTFPENYQIQTTTCRGVMKGSHKSPAIVNERLYYKARTGIMMYDGSLPVEVSEALGKAVYKNAVGGSIDNKYYVSMQTEDNSHHLFVYDTELGLWHREDNTEVTAFCAFDGELYYISQGGIKSVKGNGTQNSEDVEWVAQTGIMGLSMPDKKYISKIVMRMLIPKNAKLTVYIQYNESGVWEKKTSFTGVSLRSFDLPIRPKRCDTFRIKLEGKGDIRIFSISKTIEQGSDE